MFSCYIILFATDNINMIIIMQISCIIESSSITTTITYHDIHTLPSGQQARQSHEDSNTHPYHKMIGNGLNGFVDVLTPYNDTRSGNTTVSPSL